MLNKQILSKAEIAINHDNMPKMIQKTKKVFLMVVPVLLCLVVFFCSTTRVSAASDDTTIDLNDTVKTSGAAWEFNTITNTYTIKGDVTVIGGVYDAAPLLFEINGNYKITWEAVLYGEAPLLGDVLIQITQVTGNGVFVIEDGLIYATDGIGTALKTGSGVVVFVGYKGRIMSDNGAALDAQGKVTVESGGKIETYGNDTFALKTTGEVLVEGGGLVSTNFGWHSIGIMADDDITVYGNVAAEGGVGNIAIYSDQAIQIKLLGGEIMGFSAVIAKEASVTAGGDVFVGAGYLLSVFNGQLLGNGIMAKNVTVQENARVAALNGAAIFYSGDLSIEGGTVFAYGDGIGGALLEFENIYGSRPEYMLNVIFKAEDLNIQPGIEYQDKSNPKSKVSDEGAILVWEYNKWVSEKPATGDYYANDEKTHIILYPDQIADYGWRVEAAGSFRAYFIKYSKDNDSNEFEVRLLTGTKPLIEFPLKPNPTPDPDGNGSGGNTGSGGNSTPAPYTGSGGGTDPGIGQNPGNTYAGGNTAPGNSNTDDSSPVIGKSPDPEDKAGSGKTTTYEIETDAELPASAQLNDTIPDEPSAPNYLLIIIAAVAALLIAGVVFWNKKQKPLSEH